MNCKQNGLGLDPEPRPAQGFMRPGAVQKNEMFYL
jgi:hypothetical protein